MSIIVLLDPNHCLLLVADSGGLAETAFDIPPRRAKDISRRIALSRYEWVFADPRSQALDVIELPTKPRPLGHFGGKTLWGPSFDPDRGQRGDLTTTSETPLNRPVS